MNEFVLIRGVERIREALAVRGFSVRSLHNRLLPVPGGAWSEWGDVQEVLKSSGVECRAAGKTIAVLAVDDVEESVRAIQFHRPVQAAPKPEWYESNWKSFTRRAYGRRTSAAEHSPVFAYLAKSISKAGILTAHSFDGRGAGRPYLEFSGAWNGVWFEYLLECHMSLGDLHYHWAVTPGTYGKARLTPRLPADRRRWDIGKLQEDTVRMGRWLERHADDVRAMKRTCFKYRSMKREAEALAEDYEGLRRWMRGKIAEASTSANALAKAAHAPAKAARPSAKAVASKGTSQGA